MFLLCQETSNHILFQLEANPYLPWADCESQRLSDFRFVAVRCSAVDVSVAAVQSSHNCLLDLKNTQLLSISLTSEETPSEEEAPLVTCPAALFHVPRPTEGILWPVARVTYALMVTL